jgi:hypothetical protein
LSFQHGLSGWLAGISLMAVAGAEADLFAILNRAFGAGVFAQAFLRSLVLSVLSFPAAGAGLAL